MPFGEKAAPLVVLLVLEAKAVPLVVFAAKPEQFVVQSALPGEKIELLVV